MTVLLTDWRASLHLQGWERHASEKHFNKEYLKSDLLSIIEPFKPPKWFSYSVHAC